MWTIQGYFFDRLDAQPMWHVDTGGELDSEIEFFESLDVNISGWERRVKIIYGLSNSKFFKGYIETSDEAVIESVLRKFNGFLVYSDKYGGRKEFNFLDLKFYSKNDFTVFIENREYSKEELKGLIKDFEDYIIPDCIPENTKSIVLEGVTKIAKIR